MKNGGMTNFGLGNGGHADDGRMGSDPHRPLSQPRPAMLLLRALGRRCPVCGSTGIYRSYLHQKDACPACGLRLDRGERDFFIGAYTLNLIVAELIVFFGGMAALWLTWPDVPWTALTWRLAAAVVIFPVVLYPWSKQVWLALDLIFRPAEETDYSRVGNAPASATDAEDTA